MINLRSSKLHFECPIFAVTEEEAVEPGGLHVRRFVVRHAGSAVMLALDERGRVLLVRQYRLPARASLWELPAGRVDAGESVLAAARRELAEETGYRARRWKKLACVYPSPGYVSEKMTIYLATQLAPGTATPMEDERIECRWFTPRQIDRMIQAGRIIDGKTLVGFLTWQRYGAGRRTTR